jgi:hypothetical protein
MYLNSQGGDTFIYRQAPLFLLASYGYLLQPPLHVKTQLHVNKKEISDKPKLNNSNRKGTVSAGKEKQKQ